MRNVLPLLLLVAHAGCASAVVARQNEIRAPEVKVVRMPSQVGEYAIDEVIRYPNPAAGVLYRYRGDGPLKPDVYLYPFGDPLPGDDGPRARVKAESRVFPPALEVNRRRGRHLGVEIVADSALALNGRCRGAIGWHTTAHLQQSDGMYESHQHLFTFSDQLVKVRTTYPLGELGSAELDSFVRELVLGILREAAVQ